MATWSAAQVSLISEDARPGHAQLPAELGAVTLPKCCGLRPSILLHQPCPALPVHQPQFSGHISGEPFHAGHCPHNSPVPGLRVTNKETEAQGSCETCPSLGVGETELECGPGCRSPQNLPLPPAVGAVVSEPGWPLPRPPLLRAVPKDSLVPLTMHLAAVTSKHSTVYFTYMCSLSCRRGSSYYSVYRSGHRKGEVTFSTSVCFQKCISLLQGPIYSASIYPLLSSLDEVIPNPLLTTFPESLVIFTETRLRGFNWTSVKPWKFRVTSFFFSFVCFYLTLMITGQTLNINALCKKTTKEDTNVTFHREPTCSRALCKGWIFLFGEAWPWGLNPCSRMITSTVGTLSFSYSIFGAPFACDL